MAKGALRLSTGAANSPRMNGSSFLSIKNSFKEYDMSARAGADERTSAGVVTGAGTISGRPVYVFAKDFTVFAGAMSQGQARKICDLQDMALHNRAPIIGLCDSAGVRIDEGVAALAGYGELWQRAALASGVIPQISVIMGPCGGADVFAPALADFIFMVRETSHMFVAGPEIVKALTEEAVTADNLGGACVHAVKTGLADGVYDNEFEALRQTRRLVDFLPSSNGDDNPEWPSFDSSERIEPSLDTLVPDAPDVPYDMRELIAKTADEGDFFEIQEAHASNIVIGFGRIEGRSVGFVANQPMVLAGVLDASAARKAARFVRFCDCFNIPIVTFVDAPGFLPGTAQEHGGLIKAAAQLLFAYAEATVPKITVVTRRAFGAAYTIMASKHVRGDVNFAWPTAQIGPIGAKAAVEILLGSDRHEPADIAAMTKEYEETILSPFVAAEQGYIDDVILPHTTRSRIVRALAGLRHKRSENPRKKHDNIPL